LEVHKYTDDQTEGKRKKTLKLLLDEMYAGLKEYFETLGWEVETAQDVGLKGAKDKDIVEYAQDHDFLLVTQDQKPAELAELKGVRHVLISNGMIAKIADQEIRRKYPNIESE
jgi:predicted nuclease of predicted toxin-antitoxin system